MLRLASMIPGKGRSSLRIQLLSVGLRDLFQGALSLILYRWGGLMSRVDDDGFLIFWDCW